MPYDKGTREADVKFKNVYEQMDDFSQKSIFEKVTPLNDTEVRDRLGEIIKHQGPILVAKYSNIVGVDVGEMQVDTGRIEPCIILRCLDKTLVPFGEKTIPESLRISESQDVKIVIREDFVMFGHTCSASCVSLNVGCSIGIPSVKSSGSVGFFVKKGNPATPEYGFLTAAHVALSSFEGFYESTDSFNKHSFSVSEHNIVHPSHEDNEQRDDQIGCVLEASIGDYGKNKIGIDAAFVKFYQQDLGGTVICL